ncbi:MAG: SH3 domain-containing protein [Bacteroidales bacterium]|nr:SH3 domain-containing protein [Bacteroidales bacterium]
MKVIFRYIIIIAFTSLLSQFALSQETGKAKFDQGVTSFSSGNYQEALDYWLDLYNTGYRSANLSYNIGNAYFKMNNIPSAILFFERAWLLKPSDENINYNLQIARTLIVDRFQEIPELFFVRWYNYISLLVAANTWAVFSLVCFILSLLLLSLYIYTSRYRFKVAGFWMAMIFFLLSVSSLSFALRNKSLVYDSHRAIIISPLVSGKSSPDNSGTDLFVLHDGTKVTIEDEVGEWYEIRLSDGNKGWVPVNSLNII